MEKVSIQIFANYLGCQVLTPSGEVGQIMSVSRMGAGFVQVFFEDRSAPNNYVNYCANNLTLLLRPIDTLTEDEAKELLEAYFMEAWWPSCGSALEKLRREHDDGGSIQDTILSLPEAWLKLTGWGIDVFDLILFGLAEDKTKAKR